MIVKKYEITGMTCSGCEAKVRSSLLLIPDIISAEVSKDEKMAVVSSSKALSLENLKSVLPVKYSISETGQNEISEVSRSWFETYKPVLLIFFYITFVSSLIQWSNVKLDLMEWMRHFMAGFFLVFSFFKLLNLKGFAESYMMYDVVARKFPVWAYIYAFTELALGIAFLINFSPLLTNTVTLIVMTVSIIGVLQTVLNKRKIQCACLGAVFNLPMSTITIIEDGLMILMSGFMLMQFI